MLFNFTGPYDNGVIYAALDAVEFDGSTYVMTNTIGAAGYNPVAYLGSNWNLVVAKGDTGSQGPAGADGADGDTGAAGQGTAFKGTYDYYTAYVPMDVVVYAGYAWMSTSTQQYGSLPGVDANWAQITSIISPVWGSVTGDIQDQTDLQGVFDQIDTDISSKVPRSGCVMDANAYLDFSNGTYDSEIGGWGFGVETTANNAEAATVTSTEVKVYNNTIGDYSSLKLDQLELFDFSESKSMKVTQAGLTFPDTSQQTTAWVDAPSDGYLYLRKNGAWLRCNVSYNSLEDVNYIVEYPVT
jgi:hypothetical protein